MKLSHAAMTRPSAGQNRVGRSPNCQARGRAASRANSSALAISERSCRTVAEICTAGGGSSRLAPAKLPSTPIRM